jgi:hypothetical protein
LATASCLEACVEAVVDVVKWFKAFIRNKGR